MNENEHEHKHGLKHEQGVGRRKESAWHHHHPEYWFPDMESFKG